MLKNKMLNHIQALRGFAVFIVFLYHTNLEIFKNGYLGVDIFFVISGFVITSRLFINLNDNQINILEFYINRLKRILPNLFFIVLVTYFFYLLLGPSDFSLFNETIFALIGISNLYYINNSKDYFENIFVDPLGHTWSLGVEEQFYILFPLMIFISLRYFSKNLVFLKLMILVLLSISLFFFIHYLKINEQFAFYFSPLRFWEFLFGSLLYFLQKNTLKSNFFFIFSILILIIIFLYGHYFSYFIKNILVVITTLIYIATYRNLDFINIKKLITFGNISYSFYLWHLPVIFFAELYIINIYNIHIFFSFILTTLLSLFTYKYIEQKFRYEKKIFQKIFTKKLITFFIFLIMLLGYVKYFNDDIRYKVRNFINHINYPNLKYNWSERVNLKKILNINGNLVYENCTEASRNLDIKFFSDKNSSLDTNKVKFNINCQKLKDDDTLYFLAGNSHIAHFLPVFNDSSEIKNLYYQHTFYNDIPLAMANKASQMFNKTYLVMNISNKNQLEKISEQFKYLNKDIKLIIFNSTPHGQDNNEPQYIFKCVIQKTNCYLSKESDYSKRNLEKVFKLINNFRDKNNKRIFIFDSYNSFCKKDEKFCKVYDKNKKLIYFRDRTHILPEIKNIIIPKLNNFLVSININN